MPRESTEPVGIVPSRLSELTDVATPGTRPAALAHLAYAQGATQADDTWSVLAPAAAEADLAGAATAADTIAKVNAILAKLRAQGIIAP